MPKRSIRRFSRFRTRKTRSPQLKKRQRVSSVSPISMALFRSSCSSAALTDEPLLTYMMICGLLTGK